MEHSFLAAIVAFSLALMLTPGTIELALVTLGSLLPLTRVSRVARAERLAIVVPAHNESALIARTAQSIQASVAASGRDASVIVVADNCTDDTADRAAPYATVLVRENPQERGKGHALRFAFDRLLSDGYSRFAIVDADSSVSENFVAAISESFDAGALAVQVPYLVRNGKESWRTRLMDLALTAFNQVRPRGRAGWGFSAGIFGNGFALHQACLERVPYQAFSIVEDLEYHLALVSAGLTVRFRPDARVWGDMPTGGSGVATQRSRWEGGRLAVARRHVPGLAAALAKGRLMALEPLVDLLCLPLALHSLGLAALFAASWVSGLAVLQALALVYVTVLGAHITMALFATPRPASTVLALLAAPFYVLWKLTMIPATLRDSSRRADWVRTERPL